MKTAILTSLLLAGLSAHAQTARVTMTLAGRTTPTPTPAATPYTDPNPYQTQSWYRHSSGLIRTFSALPGQDAFQFDHPNVLPAEIIATGSNFGIFKSKSGALLIGVTDALGRFLQYDIVTEPEPGTIGGVYYLKKASREVVVVDSDGAVMDTTVTAPAVRLYGGNYYVEQDGTLVTIKSMGAARHNWSGMVVAKRGLTYPAAILAGGNFYVDADGRITTISSRTGFFSDPTALPDQDSVKVYGGTWLITTHNKLYTVDHNGALNFARNVTGTPEVRGYSYLIFPKGKFLVVRGDGSVADRVVSVAKSGKPVDLLTIDPAQVQSASVSKIGGVK